MTTDRAPSRWRPVGAAAVALLVASVLTLALVVETRPARLVSARPADGARLASPPSRIELAFSGRPDPERSHISVGPANGKPLPAGALSVAGERVSLPAPAIGEGGYLVAYHIVFDNGRTVSGVLSFAVGGAGSVRAAPATGTGAHGHGDVAPGTMLVVSVGLTALAVGSLFLLRRRRPGGIRQPAPAVLARGRPTKAGR